MRGRPGRGGHGDYGYARKHKCRCTPCITSVRRYAKRLHVDLQRGKRRMVDAAPARAHVAGLVEAGATYGQVATAAGVQRSQVKRLMLGNPRYGEVKQLAPKTEAALLAVTLQEALSGFAYVSAVGTHRRIEALQARGYSIEDMAREIGLKDRAVYSWWYQDRVTTFTVAKMDAAYQRLQMGTGDNEVVRWRARRLGYPPPLAWDEETIDDPEAKPDLSAVVCVVGGCTRSVVRRSLCSTHYEYASTMGGMRTARRYREAVLLLAKRKGYDHAGLIAGLAELKEMGVHPELAALRLEKSPETVLKYWSEV